jgi:hypothetical protein
MPSWEADVPADWPTGLFGSVGRALGSRKVLRGRAGAVVSVFTRPNGRVTFCLPRATGPLLTHLGTRRHFRKS